MITEQSSTRQAKQIQRVITVRLSSDLHIRALDAAGRNHLSLNQWCVEQIRIGVKELEANRTHENQINQSGVARTM